MDNISTRIITLGSCSSFPVTPSCQNLGQTELCGSKAVSIFLCMSYWCRTLSLYVHIRVGLGLKNFADFTLMTLWDPTPLQRFADTLQVTTGLVVPWNFCQLASNSALILSLNLYKSCKHHLPLPGGSLRTYLTSDQRLFEWLSLRISQKPEVNLWAPCVFCWPDLGLGTSGSYHGCIPWPFSCILRPRKFSHKLWIYLCSSQQLAKGQPQAMSGIYCTNVSAKRF